MRTITVNSRRKTVFVTPNSEEGGWDVKVGRGPVAYHSKLQQEAIAWGRELAKELKAEFRVQDKHGQFCIADSYGGDPFPPRDER
jgi:hypothetical protein